MLLERLKEVALLIKQRVNQKYTELVKIILIETVINIRYSIDELQKELYDRPDEIAELSVMSARTLQIRNIKKFANSHLFRRAAAVHSSQLCQHM